METNFGTSTPYSVGIEEEFQLVDPDSLELVSRIEPILASVGGETIRERVAPELLQSMLEISTRIAVTVEEAVDEVVDLRSRLGRIAADHGVALAAAGHASVLALRRAARHRPAALHRSWRTASAGSSRASRSSACTCTSAPARPRRRSRAPTGCATTSRSCLRSPRTPRCGTAGRRGHASTRATILEDLPRTGLPPALESFDDLRDDSSSMGSAPGASPTTRTSGGTCDRIRGSAPSRCGSATRRRTCRAWPRSRRSSSRSPRPSAAPSNAATSRRQARRSCSRRTAAARRATGSRPG